MSLPDPLAVMLEKARRYLDSAIVLRLRGDYDSAVSRLYYAMFYCAEALLRVRGLSYSSHKGVISAFARYFVKPNLLPKELHQWLREAFRDRQLRDYEFATGITEATVLDLEAKAAQFVQMTEEFLQREHRSD